MARLYSNLLDGSNRRFYFGLDSAASGISPSAASLNVSGLAPTIFTQVQVFRSPATLVITVNGLSVAGDPRLIPNQATISATGLAPTLLKQLVVTNALPPDYGELPSNPPTVLFINTVTPATAQVTLLGIQPNASPGGNIGFVSPGVGLVELQGKAPTLIFLEIGTGQIVVQGLQPSLFTELVVTPEVAQITVNGQAVSLERPFAWIDVDAPPSLQWTPTTGVAA
jgi:hypothetical protein